MPTVTYVEYDGTEHEAELVDGDSLMVIATSNAIPGIDGDCGGEASCGTCHVIVDDAWIEVTGRRSATESQMVDMSPECEPNSRLSCQIKANAALDGLRVRLPEYQL